MVFQRKENDHVYNTYVYINKCIYTCIYFFAWLFFICCADQTYWINASNDLLRRKLDLERQYGVAKNVIFFLGDGMSIATLAASRMYMGQLDNKTGESEMLSFEKFPFTGLSKVSGQPISVWTVFFRLVFRNRKHIYWPV